MAGPTITIRSEGLDEIADAWRLVASRATRLRPMAWRLRSRWIESEQRLWDSRPWADRKPSTLKRYEHPVRHPADQQLHRGPTGGTMEFTGLTRRSLTSAQSIGTTDTVDLGRAAAGQLDLTVGIKGNGPLFYAAINQAGAGERPAREIVAFDPKAHREASADVVDYLLSNAQEMGSGW